MSVPTQTSTRLVPFNGGPLNATIIAVPEPLPGEYAVGGPLMPATDRYVLAEDGSHYAWLVVDRIPDETIRDVPAIEAEQPSTIEVRPAMLGGEPVVERPARRGSRRVAAAETDADEAPSTQRPSPRRR